MGCKVNLRNELDTQPEYSGSENEVESGTQACPAKKEDDKQSITDFYFCDKNGKKLEKITSQEEVELVVCSKNMAGEELVIDIPEIAGNFKFNDQLMTADHVFVLQIQGDQEKIALKVVPQRLDIE